MAGPTAAAGYVAVATEHLRDPHRFMAEEVDGRIAGLSGDGGASGEICEGDGIHARGILARGRARVLSIVGIPGDRVLRADEPVRDAGRFSIPGEHAARGGNRSDCRLGAGALPTRRLGVGAFRWHSVI